MKWSNEKGGIENGRWKERNEMGDMEREEWSGGETERGMKWGRRKGRKGVIGGEGGVKWGRRKEKMKRNGEK